MGFNVSSRDTKKVQPCSARASDINQTLQQVIKEKTEEFFIPILHTCQPGALMATRRNVKYSRLADEEDDQSYNFSDADHIRGKGYDPRFDYTPKSLDKVPWKSILLALFLLSLGCFLLFLSVFILTGHMGGEQNQAYGLFALGILTFLPGFYETRIAYYSWRGASGYRFAAIPDY